MLDQQNTFHFLTPAVHHPLACIPLTNPAFAKSDIFSRTQVPVVLGKRTLSHRWRLHLLSCGQIHSLLLEIACWGKTIWMLRIYGVIPTEIGKIYLSLMTTLWILLINHFLKIYIYAYAKLYLHLPLSIFKSLCVTYLCIGTFYKDKMKWYNIYSKWSRQLVEGAMSRRV